MSEENNISESENPPPITVKVSKLALIAIFLAISGLVLTFIIPVFILHPGLFLFMQILYCLYLVILIGAIILGIISEISISLSNGLKTGSNFASGAIILPLLAFLISSILFPFFYKFAPLGYQLVCQNNLSSIGKAMLIYTQNYDGKLPRAGGKNSNWGTSVKWDAATSQEAFGLDSNDTGGAATISSSLYLLIKYTEVIPKSFICRDDKKVTEFKPEKYGIENKSIADFWDFGQEPWKHSSYSYHMPYSQFQLTEGGDPGMVIVADRNPFIPSPGWPVKDITAFNPNGDRTVIKKGNSPVHQNEGQNVMYLDCHVAFEQEPYCGINDDNIYTLQDDGYIRKGTPPKMGSQPANREDSLLVNDPPQ